MSDDATPTDQAPSETPPREETPQERAARAAAAAPKPRRSAWWLALHTIVLFLALVVVASWLARWSWLLDLTAHFRLQYAILLSMAAVVLLLGRWFKWGLVVAVLAGTQFWALVPYYGDSPDIPRGEARARLAAAQAAYEEPPTAEVNDFLMPGGPMAMAVPYEPVPGRDPRWVRVMSVNVHTSNLEYRRLLELVRQERPDFLLVMECDRGWIDALQDLPADYIDRVEEPRSHNFGMALYGRYPLNAEVFELGSDTFPAIVSRTQTPGGPVTLLGAHTLPPMSGEAAEVRNEQLATLARLVENEQGRAAVATLDVSPTAAARQEPPPVVVIGDWNITNWSPRFADFVEITGLKDTRRGLGLQTSWPAILPAPLRIPIDHALVSPEIEVLDRRVGEAIGSDHLPIILDLILPEPPAEDEVDADDQFDLLDELDSLDIPLE